MAAADANTEDAVGTIDPAEVERWFLRRGVPHLIDGYAPSTDIFTRVWWLLGLILLAESVAGANREMRWWVNGLVVMCGLGILLAGLMIVNRTLGRGLLERPSRLGGPELTAFVLLPALLPVVFGLHWKESAFVAAMNVALLGAIYVVTGYGLVPMARWAIQQLASQLLDLANLLVRTLPLLALFSMFLFLNAELWQVAGDAPLLLIGAACGLLVLVGIAFTLLRVPQELSHLETPGTWEDLEPLVVGTPAEGVQHVSVGPMRMDLPARARANLVLVGLFRLGVQIGLASLLVGAFYIVFGILVIQDSTIDAWIGHAPSTRQVLWRVDLFGNEVILTRQLLKVAAFLATFGGLQITVSALTDSTYREEFFDDLTRELKQVLAVKQVYQDSIGRSAE